MNKREFITLLGGAAAWPLTVHAQQRERVRRIGVIMALAADDPASQLGIAGFLQGLQELGWVVGRNIRIEFVEDGGLISHSPSGIGNYRLAAGYIDRILKGEKPADLPAGADQIRDST
jgi:hypothetical protein